MLTSSKNADVSKNGRVASFTELKNVCVDYKCLVFICLGNMYKQCTISKCPWECRSIKCPLCYSNIHIFVTLMIFMWFIGRKLTFCNHLLKLSFIDQEENSKYADFMSQKMCRLLILSSITLTYSMLPP